MGKRKLNGTNFYQCDWTGFPMKQVHCYMPSWSPSGKLIKKGSYCNWESVIAHAAHLKAKDELEEVDHDKITTYIQVITGTAVHPAPHYDELQHTKGRLNVTAFHEACSKHTGPILAVKVSPNGEVFEIMLTPDPSGRFDIESYMHKPYIPSTPSTFHSMRKKGATKGTDRDLSVWYYPTKELPHNPTASNMFKMQLYGDILMIQQSREASFLPRERFVSFTKQNYDEQFAKKRRKTTAEPPSLTPAAYEELKDQMQASLNSFEQKVAASAEAPQAISKALNSAPMSAKGLAGKLKDRGYTVPTKPGDALIFSGLPV